MDKNAQRQAMIDALVNQVDEWTEAQAKSFAKNVTRQLFEDMSDSKLTVEYNREFSEEG